MPAGTKVDKWANIIYAAVTETAANTLTFAKIETGYGTLNRVGWIIHRIEWYLGVGTPSLVVDNSDALQCAIVKSNLVSAITLDQAAVIDLYQYQLHNHTSVGFTDQPMPIIRDFTMLPGGGRLVLPYPLYVAVRGISLASAATIAARIFFTELELTDADWVEMVEQTRLLV